MSKNKLRDKADEIWKQKVMANGSCICEVCGKPAITGHHYYPKSCYGHLRFEVRNGVSICAGCHMKHHISGDPSIHLAIQRKRGDEWVEELRELSLDRPIGTYLRKSWYETKTRELNDN